MINILHNQSSGGKCPDKVSANDLQEALNKFKIASRALKLSGQNLTNMMKGLWNGMGEEFTINWLIEMGVAEEIADFLGGLGVAHYTISRSISDKIYDRLEEQICQDMKSIQKEETKLTPINYSGSSQGRKCATQKKIS